MLIATVDKFAMMSWKGEAKTLFGRVSKECPRHGFLWADAKHPDSHSKKGVLPSATVKTVKPLRPPDLIIQDEFHLISGPLGTMVGLYESAVDELSSWTLNGKRIKPKIIASTATVRKAEKQINNVFLRQMSIFPPHGLDIEDNFFSVQRSTETIPGREYIGICSPGSSRPAVLIRVFVAFLTAAKALFDKFGQAADPYMTLVGYFNSLRELGGMRRLAEDDVQTRSFRVGMSNVLRPGLAQRSVKFIDELTSRVNSKDIPKKLGQRAWKVTDNKAALNNIKKMIAERLDRWVKEAKRPGRVLGYEKKSRQGSVAPLLKKPGLASLDTFTVPMSMREVEPGVRLIMNDPPSQEPPPWKVRPLNGNDDDNDSSDGGEA